MNDSITQKIREIRKEATTDIVPFPLRAWFAKLDAIIEHDAGAKTTALDEPTPSLVGLWAFKENSSRGTMHLIVEERAATGRFGEYYYSACSVPLKKSRTLLGTERNEPCRRCTDITSKKSEKGTERLNCGCIVRHVCDVPASRSAPKTPSNDK